MKLGNRSEWFWFVVRMPFISAALYMMPERPWWQVSGLFLAIWALGFVEGLDMPGRR